jgi:class 3 adenylate cyclase/pSer/pThr/pTyr-binding forkhead associated (FHA) protein
MTKSKPDSVTTVLQSLIAHPEMMAELERFRRSICVLFTDIKGSTAYFERYGDAAGLAMVHACNELQKERVEQSGGRVIKFIGDAVMAVFDQPEAAVAAAVEMQKGLQAFNERLKNQEGVFLRIGLHFGSGIVKSDDVFGDVVNIASRVQSAALPDQIVVTESVVEKLPPDRFQLHLLGKFAFKGKGDNHMLYSVLWKAGDTAPEMSSQRTMVLTEPTKAAQVVRLQHKRPDGSPGKECSLGLEGLTIGRSQGDLQFPDDSRLQPLHARLYMDGPELMVENLSGSLDLMVRLAEPHTLQDGDHIKLGRRIFRFVVQADALAAAAASGTRISDLSTLLKRPPAELLQLLPPSLSPMRVPLSDQSVIFGRDRGHYTFPDDTFMSRSHARIYQRGEDFFLEDLGSRNGTFVHVAERARVSPGSAVLAGRQLLERRS